MNFALLCDFLDNVRTTTGISKKQRSTKEFFRTLRDEHRELFPVLRLIIPKLDRDRPSFRIKESKISRLLIKMLGLPPGHDYNLLSKAVTASAVDFGDIVFSVLKKYIVNTGAGLTVVDVNTYLDRIANRAGDAGLDDLMLEIFRKLSPKSVRWLVQIILKDLKLGISDNSVLNCFHPDGANFYASNNNLRKLCEVLADPRVKLHELEINIFEAFRPMLSKRCDASNFRRCFPDGKTFFVETKFDGERFQLHFDGGQFKYISRNGYDFTDSFGASFAEGSLSPRLRDAFDPETKRAILDGEMMLWNKHTENFGSKGMTMDVKKLGIGKYQSCFCVFDILLHNDKVLTDQPLKKRLQLLQNVVKNPVCGSIVTSKYTEGHSKSDIINALNLSVDNNEEGIVVKDPTSAYKCGDRNGGWFKIKMEYFDDVVHDLDVLMMGGCFGANDKINSFFVGVSSGRDVYFSFGRISSGLTVEQLDLLNDKLRTRGVGFEEFSTKSEGKLFFGRETPDVYIEPQHSCVLQIRATELIRTTSDGVKCPYTLRFPRVVSVREDKPVDECFSMNELLELTAQNKFVIKLNKRHIELDEVKATSKPTKKAKIEVVGLGQAAVETGDFLSDKRFYVDSGTDTWPIEDVLFSIKKAGGTICYRLEAAIDVVLVSKITPKISDLLKQSHSFDVVHVDWLQRVLQQGKLLNYNKEEIFYCGTNYRKDIATSFDRFGDSFTEKITKRSLEKLFEKMTQNDVYLNTNGGTSVERNRLFDKRVAYFDSFEEINNPSSKKIYYSLPDELHFQYYKGTVSREITANVNLIVINENCDKRQKIVYDFLEKRGFYNVEIVTKDVLQSRLSRDVL